MKAFAFIGSVLGAVLLAACGTSSGEPLPTGAPPIAPLPATITVTNDGDPAFGGTYAGFIKTANLAGKVSSVFVQTDDANPIANVGFQFPAMLEAGKTYTSASMSSGYLDPLPQFLNPETSQLEDWGGLFVLSRKLVVTSVGTPTQTGNGEWAYFDIHGTLTVVLVDVAYSTYLYDPPPDDTGINPDAVTVTATF